MNATVAMDIYEAVQTELRRVAETRFSIIAPWLRHAIFGRAEATGEELARSGWNVQRLVNAGVIEAMADARTEELDEEVEETPYVPPAPASTGPEEPRQEQKPKSAKPIDWLDGPRWETVKRRTTKG